MSTQKLNPSLLPKPQRQMGWKNRQLQINTEEQHLNNTFNHFQQQPTIRNSQLYISKHQNDKRQANNAELQMKYEPLSTKNYSDIKNSGTFNNFKSNHKNIQNQKTIVKMTASQESLEQKQLLTFAAENNSIENQQQREQRNAVMLIQSQQSSKRKNYLIDSVNPSNLNNKGQSIKKSSSKSMNNQQNNNNRSSSKNKQHRFQIYRHQVKQTEQFVAYSVVTKQSKSGMFSNQKILVLNSLHRQLQYYSKLPKYLPFDSYEDMMQRYLSVEQPKQVIQFDKMRKFLFVPSKGNIAQVAVSYLNEANQRKQWKLGMGNNSVMNEWIQLVYQVIKTQHYSTVKSQTKYPPKPKKQLENKSNNYETRFTKTLKNQVLPIIKKQSRIKQSKQQVHKDSPQIYSYLQGAKNSQSQRKQKEKKIYVDSSKFVNTKQYIIDLDDARQQDIFYIPTPVIKQTKSQVQKSQNQQQHRNQRQLGESKMIENMRFSQELEKKQQIINNLHKDRIQVQFGKNSEEVKRKQQSKIKQESKNKSEAKNKQETKNGNLLLMRKGSSGSRLSQTTHKDLNIHIDSKLFFDDMEQYQNDHYEQINKMNNQKYHKHRYQQSDSETNKIIRNNGPENVKRNDQFSQDQQHFNQNDRNKSRNNISTPSNKNNQFSNISTPISKKYKQNINTHLSHNISNPLTHQYYNYNDQNASQTGHKLSHSIISKPQTEDNLMNTKLQQSKYILNFSSNSVHNNWLRLWLQTAEPSQRVQMYTSFIKSCQALVQKIIDNPSSYIEFSVLTQSYIIFQIEHITLKIPFKLKLPQGIGNNIISLVDFIRSEQFLANIFEYQNQLQYQFNNYSFILRQLHQQFVDGVSNMPICVPMACLVKYKGISVLCKANIQSSGLKIHKIPEAQHKRYHYQIEYLQQKCHVSFFLNSTPNILLPNPSRTFELYNIWMPQYNKSLLYIQNLHSFLPMIKNPLSHSKSIQLPSEYIQKYINSGKIQNARDLQKIEQHLKSEVVRKCIDVIESDYNQIITSLELLTRINKFGLPKQYIGQIYAELTSKRSSIGNSLYLRQTLLTQILLVQYMKVCRLFFLKQFIQQTMMALNIKYANQTSNSNNAKLNYKRDGQRHSFQFSSASNNSKTIKNLQMYSSNILNTNLTGSFANNVLEMLHYLIYKNSKIWNVLLNVIREKYKISDRVEFIPNKKGIQAKGEIFTKINIKYLVLNFFSQAGVEGELLQWDQQSEWSNYPVNESTILVTPVPALQHSYSLKIFSLKYKQLLQNLVEIIKIQSSKPSKAIISSSLYSQILSTLNIYSECFNNTSHLIKSPEYQLIQINSQYEKQIIDLGLSYFISTDSSITKHKLKSQNGIRKNYNRIELYSKLFQKNQFRKSSSISYSMHQLSFIGIKWLVKSMHYQIASILIQQQLQLLRVWVCQDLYSIKMKFFDFIALFYQKKLNNKNDLAFQYALKSLQLAITFQSNSALSICAEKSYNAANIHFECSQSQKAFQLYKLTQKFTKQDLQNIESRKSIKQKKSNLCMLEFAKISLKKAQINLSKGNTIQSLHDCLQCLKRCDQIQQDYYLETLQSEQKFIEFFKLQDLQIFAFETIFRCYQITNSHIQMKNISELCLCKFIEDKVRNKFLNNFHNRINSQYNIRFQVMTKLLKMGWISLINYLRLKQTIHNQEKHLLINQQQISLKKIPLSNLPKSFCLSEVLLNKKRRKTIEFINQYNLQEAKQKLLALCRLYPENRYNKQTLTEFLCHQIYLRTNAQKQLENITRNQYQEIMRSRKSNGMIDKIQKMMVLGQRENYNNQGSSILLTMIWEVLIKFSTNSTNHVQLANSRDGLKNSNQFLIDDQQASSNKSRQSVNFSNWLQERNQNQKKLIKQVYSLGNQSHMPQNSKTSKQRSDRTSKQLSNRRSSKEKSFLKSKVKAQFYNQQNQRLNQPESRRFNLPLGLEDQYYAQDQNRREEFQPQLRIDLENNSNHSYSSPYKISKTNPDKISKVRTDYNLFSLKDQMQIKYMIIEATFGLCGRQFVLGILNETIQQQKAKCFDYSNSKPAFYE